MVRGSLHAARELENSCLWVNPSVRVPELNTIKINKGLVFLFYLNSWSLWSCCCCCWWWWWADFLHFLARTSNLRTAKPGCSFQLNKQTNNKRRHQTVPSTVLNSKAISCAVQTGTGTGSDKIICIPKNVYSSFW